MSAHLIIKRQNTLVTNAVHNGQSWAGETDIILARLMRSSPYIRHLITRLIYPRNYIATTFDDLINDLFFRRRITVSA